MAYASGIGDSGGKAPDRRIWKKWSMTQSESKPASSAWRARLMIVGPSWLTGTGQEKSPNASPSFIE